MTEEQSTYIELADGTKIDPETGSVVGEVANEDAFVEVPNMEEAQRQMTAVRRKLMDLPMPPDRMHAVSLVVMYTMYGLSDADIAIAVGIDPTHVERIKETEAYEHVYDAVTQNIAAQDVEDVRGILHQASKSAAYRLAGLVHSPSQSIALQAANSMLDRNGHRPADVVEHKHSLEGGLLIEYVHTNKDEDVPIIDVTPQEIT